MKLPSFFVVGTQKAGTTSLHNWLIQQPEVVLPNIKETHFFDDERRYSFGIEWYIKQFGKCGSSENIVGEICPDYMFFPQSAIRIKRYISAPGIVFIFREPIERAFSHYSMSVERGHEELSFPDALKAEHARLSQQNNITFSMNHHSYFARSRYAEQIERFLAHFPSSDVLFIKFDDLMDINRGIETYERFCKFIGVKSNSKMADRTIKKNVSGEPRSIFIRNFVHKGGRIRHYLSYLIPYRDIRTKLKVKLDEINKRPYAAKPDVPYDLLPKSIILKANNEIEKLEKITKIDCADWKHK